MKHSLVAREPIVWSSWCTTIYSTLYLEKGKSAFRIAQNKNITVSYLACRVMVGLNQSYELNFMLVGHIHFSPDHFIGLIQRKD